MRKTYVLVSEGFKKEWVQDENDENENESDENVCRMRMIRMRMMRMCAGRMCTGEKVDRRCQRERASSELLTVDLFRG